MKFSTYAGTAIMPTLGRLVLCAAFVSAGWNKCFRLADFTPSQGLRLQELGVSAWKKPPVGEITVRAGNSGHVTLASLRQDGDPTQDEKPAAAPPPVKAAPLPAKAAPPPAKAAPPPAKALPADDQTPDDPEATKTVDPAPPAVQPPPAPPSMVDEDVYQSRAVHHVSLMVDARGWPYPVLLGWAAGLTELFGGALLLVGLFSRIWGLGLAITMGVAFYMTSWAPLLEGIVFDLTSMKGAQAFSTLVLQLALFVLALGIMLTGPGPISLDHRIFRRSRRSTIEYDSDHDSERSSLRAF